MIRINLLPFRAARKRENIRRQVSIYGLTLVFFIFVLGFYFFQLTGDASDLAEKQKKINAELDSYQKELEEIKKLDKMISEVKTKLDVIKELEKKKTGPVLLLSAIADAVPKDKLWLTSLKENNGSLTLTGTAMDNETIALFMVNLENAKTVITSVPELTSATLKELPQYKLKVSDFVLDCKTYAYKAPQKVEKKADKK